MQRYMTLKELGVTVVPVETLQLDVALIRNLGVGLVRADLSPERHAKALDWLLDQRRTPPEFQHQ